MDYQDLLNKIKEWKHEHVETPNINAIFKHLDEELEHLAQNISNPLALADVFILLLSLVDEIGLNMLDVHKAIESKMVINRLREWNPPDENGVIRHKNE